MAKKDQIGHLQKGLLDTIKKLSPSSEVFLLSAGYDSLSSIRQAAEAILAIPSITQINVMFNIPTELPRPGTRSTRTKDGLEYLLQANYLSHFLLTNKLMPKLLEAPDKARVVNISSSANMISGIRWHDANYYNDSYEPWAAYGQTKTAAILFSVALNRRRSIHSYAVHPGGVKTKLQEQLSAEHLEKAFEATKHRLGEDMAREFFTWKTLSAAASTPLVAALDPSLPEREGVWLEDCELVRESRHLHPRSTDPEDAERLWGLSEQFVGERFGDSHCKNA